MVNANDPLMGFLTEEGYLPKQDAEGVISFKKEGRIYLSYPERNDPNYFNVYCLINVGDLVTSKEQGLAAANRVNRRIKSIKVTFPDLDTLAALSFGVEVLLDRPESFRAVFERAIAILIAGVELFHAEIMPSPPERE